MDIQLLNQKIQINCRKHPNKAIQFVQINQIPNDDKDLFFCSLCLNNDEDYNLKNFLCIDQVLEYDENQIIYKWPLLSDKSIYKKIEEYTEKNNNISSLSTKIDAYFENLKSEIINEMEKLKKKMINQCESIPTLSNHILQKYSDFSQINTFKQILVDSNTDINQKQNQFREFLQKVEIQKETNTEVLQSLIQKYEENLNLIDFETPDKIKSSIMQLITQINFFSVDKNVFDDINSEIKQNNNQTNTQLIIDLISTKSNYCSQKFLASIRSSLTKISSFIERINFEEVFIADKKPIDFSNLNDQYLDFISDFSQHFTKLSQDSENQTKQLKNNEKIKEIMNVVNLKSNYLKQDFQNEFEKYLIEAYPLLTKLNFDTIFSENSKIQAFQELSDQTLNNMIDLIEKIRENEKNGNGNEQTLKIKQYCSALQKRDFLDEDLDKLYSNYPIFDLLNPHQQIDILQSIQFIKTNFQQSQQYLQIVKNQQNNQISISLNSENSNWTNCVSDFILDENTNYVFRFSFTNNSQSSKYMMIGLVRDSQKDSTTGYNDYMSCYFYIYQSKFYCGSYGIDKKEKGDFSVVKQNQEIEMRVCICQGILQILDYPHYNHILSITDQHKSKLQLYKNLRLNIQHQQKDLNINLIYAQKTKQNK